MTSSSEIDFQITNSCKNTADKKETYKNDKCDKGRYLKATFRLHNYENDTFIISAKQCYF